MNIEKLINQFEEIDTTLPALFIGHGSPMNGIEINDFSQTWARLGAEIPTPKSVLCISAHWLTKGTAVTAMTYPRTIHDFGGFPSELYQVKYPAPGSPDLAEQTKSLIKKTTISLDHDWGLDHGTWTVVRHMYPEANIPVLQLSIDYNRPAAYHYELGRDLASLRKRGVLIIGSGNMVHNLGMVAWNKISTPDFGFDWAKEMNTIFKSKLKDHDNNALINYPDLHKSAMLAIPTPDHYFPLMYVLGAKTTKDKVSFFNDHLVGGSLTMTGVKYG